MRAYFNSISNHDLHGRLPLDAHKKRKGVRRPLSLPEMRLASPYMNTEAPQFCSIGGAEFAGRQYWTSAK